MLVTTRIMDKEKMRSIFWSGCLLLIILSCQHKSTGKRSQPHNATDNAPSNSQTPIMMDINNENYHTVYFKASGTEPFWSLEIAENQIKLKTLEDSILTPHAPPARAMDANVKRYDIETESSTMNIQITQNQCTNARSGEVSPYTVSLAYKKTADDAFSTLEGCGQYITDYRLHDIWALEQLNGEKVTQADFSRELPYMEINSGTNSFMGFAGCNRMNGKIFYEPEVIRFSHIITTKMMCPADHGKEQEFLQALRSVTTYNIANLRLMLSNPDGELLVFKKVD